MTFGKRGLFAKGRLKQGERNKTEAAYELVLKERIDGKEMTEHQHQAELFKWANIQAITIPELALMFAIPNGGQRNIIVATRLKAEGVKSGVPDIFLPVPRGGENGLFIELKTPKGKPSANQREWIGDLGLMGYRAVFCYGWESAKDEILDYLKI